MHLPRTSAPSHGQGFALIATLLLSFLVISLLVALMSIALVEARVVTNQMKLNRARSIAMYGVSAALWRLNDYNGLDWRATATAGMLDSDPATPDIDGVENPWLAGVWTGRGKTSAEQHDKPITWLISGAKDYPSRAPELNAQDPSTPDQQEPVTPQTKLPDPAPGANTVWLLRNPVNKDPKLSVKARKVDLLTTRPFRTADPDQKYVMGHYAWWAADEGVKARVNLTLPDSNSQTALPDDAQKIAQWRLCAPQRAASLITGFESMPNDPDKLAKVLTFAQIPLMEGGSGSTLAAALATRWHDVTADSHSLITNSHDGGLKLDLSLFFEMPEADRSKYASDQNLDTLIDFYQTWKRVQNRTTQPALEAQAFSIKPADSNKSSLASAASAWLDTVASGNPTSPPARCLFSPLVVRMTYAFSLQAQSEAPREADGADRKLVLVLDPVVTLWNPYNVVLQLDAFRVDAWLPSMHLVVEKRDPWKTQKLYKPNDEVWYEGVLYRAVTASLGATPDGDEAPAKWVPAGRDWSLATDILAADVLRHHNSSSRPRFLLLQQKSTPQTRLSLRPGEFVTFSLNSSQITPPQQGNVQPVLEPGWNASGGLSFDRLADERSVLLGGTTVSGTTTGGTFTLAVTEPLVRVYADSEVRVTLEPARDASYAAADPFGFVQNYTSVGLASQDAETLVTPMFWRESIGYRNGDGASLDGYDWAGVRTGSRPEFTHRIRAYAGVDDTGRSLPGMSAILKIGTDLTADAKRYFGAIDWQMKSDADVSGFPVPMIAQFDPRTVILRNPTQGYPATLPHYQIKARVITSGDQVLGANQPLAGGARDFAPLFEVPTAPLLSIGQLQHYPVQGEAPLLTGWRGYTLGNSWCSPWCPLTSSMNNQDLDVSYQANQVFDRYFFSSITPRPDEDTVNGRLADWLSPKISKPLPNPRMKFLLNSGTRRQDLLTALTIPLDEKNNPVAPYRRVAANLLIEGAFNVNSTSVEAWKAVLGSLKNTQSIPTYDAQSLVLSMAASSLAPMPRFTLVNGGADAQTTWRGYRSLSAQEIESLAKEIVREVKTRGPFVSLSDFVNRRLASDDTGKKGALQAAIDRTGINKSWFTAQLTRQQLDDAATLGSAAGMDWSFPYPDNLTGDIAAGAPGYLTQADVLQVLAPHLVTRSDTYKIRSYGDVVNPVTGRLEARAWVEVIVQRMPDFVNYPNPNEKPEDFVSDPPWTQTPNLHNISNRVYGRRWRVVRVRWLSPEEV